MVSKTRSFEPGILVRVLLAGAPQGSDYLEIDEQGKLVIQGAEPRGFHMILALRKDARIFIVQKIVGTEGGGYSSRALANLQPFSEDYRAIVMNDPLNVIRVGNSVWTGWHSNQVSNRVDCWILAKDGKLDLYQIGIFTHDNGKTWRLHGEYRWRGQLYQDVSGKKIGLPEHSKWGSLEGGTSKRTQIFDRPEFRALLQDAKLPTWQGSDAQIDPPLPKVPGPGFAVLQWYIQFAGQTGQGPVILHDGSTAWIHGIDVEGFDPDSTVPPLWRGDIVSYTGTNTFGTKPGKPPKLVGVKLHSRAW